MGTNTKCPDGTPLWLDMVRLRTAALGISVGELLESWETVKDGGDFRETPLGKKYQSTK